MRKLTLLCLASVCFGQPPDPLNYRDFSTTNGLRLLGATTVESRALRLTPSLEFQHGAAWRTERLAVREGFETAFRFRISDPQGLDNGADGFAFVLQNNGPDALAGRGASGGFGLGDGRGDRSKPGIANSLAIFFDTHRNPEDNSGNAISILTNGDKKKMRWPPPRLAVNWKPQVQLKDERTHEVRILFAPPLLSVYVDDHLELRGPVDLARILGPDGKAYVGFTAATGAGYENHDILDWRFRPSNTSDAYTVDSEISFARFPCLPAKSLCTPTASLVEPLGPGRFHIIVPAHLPWSAEIPNPQGRPIVLNNRKGAICWLPSASACGSAADRPAGELGALAIETKNGRTRFGITDSQPQDNEGYYEFTVEIEP